MNFWFQYIINLLHNEQQETVLPVATIFDGIYLPKHKLQLHFISLINFKAQQISDNYFAEISNTAQLQHIKCIHIWEDVFALQPQLIEARILALIGIRQRIHARATIGKRIDKITADVFLAQHHLQQSAGAYYKFGLYDKNELVAVATFSKSRIMNDGIVPYRSYELIRFASRTGITVTGGLSKLLSLFINEVNAAHIMTYADRDWSNGEGYIKLGFELKEQTKPQYFRINTQTQKRYSAQILTQQDSENYLLITNAGSLKFVLDRRT